MANWVVSVSVKPGLTLSLVALMSCIVAGESEFEERGLRKCPLPVKSLN
jgi:hypothetical protein